MKTKEDLKEWGTLLAAEGNYLGPIFLEYAEAWENEVTELRSENDDAHRQLNVMGIYNIDVDAGRFMTLAERLQFVVSLEHHLEALKNVHR
jgi:hypothetical protein